MAITHEQAGKLWSVLGPHQRFLNRLVDRLSYRGYAPTDPIFAAAIKARASMQDLAVHVHYASIERGVGTPGVPETLPNAKPRG